MNLEGTRFGQLLIDEARTLELPRGLVGFASHTRFALVEVDDGPIAWLQSLSSPAIAFPVIDGALVPDYPNPSMQAIAIEMGMDTRNVSILVLVAAQSPNDLVLNLLAPIVIDLDSRRGAQAVLDPRRYKVSTKLGSSQPKALADANVHEIACAAKQSLMNNSATTEKVTPA